MKSIFSIVILAITFSVSIYAQKLTVEDLVANHLKSIGASETLKATKSIVAVGDASATFVTKKSLPAQGRIVLASAGEKSFWGMSFNATDYPFEKFSFDGSKSKVAFLRPGVRSIFGNFVAANSRILEESLLSGTLSTSWTLANLVNNKAKLNFEGIKKIDKKEVYALGYSPKGGGDLDIKLYFDKETFRHLRTEYKRTSSAGIGTRPEQSTGFSESRLKIVEDFSNFSEEKGLTLPHSYAMNYSIIGQNGTTEIKWQFNLTEFAFNQNLDVNTFDAEAK